MSSLGALRQRIVEEPLRDEAAVVADRLTALPLDEPRRAAVSAEAARLVERLRASGQASLMDTMLAEYGLSTDEGVALMCLAEAYLRVPDAPTLDALIRDKIGGRDWARHAGESGSLLVNASTWGLMLTGQLYEDGWAEDALLGSVRKMIRRVGEPVVRTAVAQCMKIMGAQFVLGRTLDEAWSNGAPLRAKGYVYSFDMLGEAARTAADANHYFQAYAAAITAVGARARPGARPEDCHAHSGVSVKLSALHPRYEEIKRERVMQEVVPRLSALAEMAAAANIGLTVDAEEADRLDLSLSVLEAVLRAPTLARWQGFGIVVQAYLKTALPTVDWVIALAQDLGRPLAVRLVKGAYWDAEIKAAQVLGLPAYPVFTRKASTDVSYMACAGRLMAARDCIYPMFASHNAHTTAAVLALAEGRGGFEFQRLHGMGETLHDLLRQDHGHRCRIYAPVGVHKDLLAYLVRRLLENGANSSFVNQALDPSVPPAALGRDPVATLQAARALPHARLPLPPALFAPERRNSQGWNLNSPFMARTLDAALAPWRQTRWEARPLTPGTGTGTATGTGMGTKADLPPPGAARPLRNPAHPDDIVGTVIDADPTLVPGVLAAAAAAVEGWRERPAIERAALLDAIAERYEAHAPELLALLIREAGKTRGDAVAELREAVDFCRYYAAQARSDLAPGGRLANHRGRGVIVCISPWNFPLAIFTGQVTAALAAGNTVVAKPAEQTPLIAARAVELMRAAGLPDAVLALLPGDGPGIGAALTRAAGVAGVSFTGSTETAVLIDRAQAAAGAGLAPFVAETGGLNAMIVDSTALPEHAVRDIVTGAFQSAGQRCSALRVLVVQDDIAADLLTMLEGAMRELTLGDPWDPATDVGPVIDAQARAEVQAHIDAQTAAGRLLFQHEAIPTTGHFVAPTVLRLDRFEDLEREIFGPVLHVVRTPSHALDDVIESLNRSGYGLTLGIHSRIDARVERLCGRARVGNIYVNRNQIGAVVGVQPFGGEGLSGTGPKAGGPATLERLMTGPTPSAALTTPPLSAPPATGAPRLADLLTAQRQWEQRTDRLEVVGRVVAGLPDPMRAVAQQALSLASCLALPPRTLPGPTGESNRLIGAARGLMACLGPTASQGLTQTLLGLVAGNAILTPWSWPLEDLADLVAPLPGPQDETLRTLAPLRIVAHEGGPQARHLRKVLADRDGARCLLISLDVLPCYATERVVSIDTTASGGNATLLMLDED